MVDLEPEEVDHSQKAVKTIHAVQKGPKPKRQSIADPAGNTGWVPVDNQFIEVNDNHKRQCDYEDDELEDICKPRLPICTPMDECIPMCTKPTTTSTTVTTTPTTTQSTTTSTTATTTNATTVASTSATTTAGGQNQSTTKSGNETSTEAGMGTGMGMGMESTTTGGMMMMPPSMGIFAARNMLQHGLVPRRYVNGLKPIGGMRILHSSPMGAAMLAGASMGTVMDRNGQKYMVMNDFCT